MCLLVVILYPLFTFLFFSHIYLPTTFRNNTNQSICAYIPIGSFRLSPPNDGHHLVLVPVVQVPRELAQPWRNPQDSSREVNRPDHQGTGDRVVWLVLLPPRGRHQNTIQPLCASLGLRGSLPTPWVVGSSTAPPAVSW